MKYLWVCALVLVAASATSGYAFAQSVATIPSISVNAPPAPSIAPQREIDAQGQSLVQPLDSPAPGSGGGWNEPPTVPSPTVNSGLTGWLNGIFSTDGWLDATKSYGLMVAVGLMSIMVLWPLIRKMASGEQPELDKVFGSSIGIFIINLPTLVLIARYDQWVNAVTGIACNAALGLATKAGDTVQTAGGVSTNPALVCAGQLNPVSMLALAGKYAVAVFSMQIPIPHETGGAWSWIMGPIASMGDNLLASGIALLAVLISCGAIVYAALELVLIAVEAAFASTLMPMFIPLKLFPPTEHLGNGGEQYLGALATRIFFLLLPVGIGFTMLNTELSIVQSGNMSFLDLLYLLGSCILYVIIIFKMKKFAAALIEGKSSMSTMQDVVKPAVTAALEVASLAFAGFGAMALMGGGAAALAGSGAPAAAGAGGGFADLGMASPVAGGAGGVEPPTAPPGSMLQPPRYDIVPSSAEPMAPPLALPGEVPAASGPPDSPAPSASGAEGSPRRPRGPGSGSASDATDENIPDGTHANAAGSAASASRSEGTEVPPEYNDLEPPSFTRTEEAGGVTWALDNADALRRAAAARRDSMRSDGGAARSGGTTQSGVAPPTGPDAARTAPPPPSDSSASSGFGSAPTPGATFTASSTASGGEQDQGTSTDAGGSPTFPDAVDAQFRSIEETPSVAPSQPTAPKAPASRKKRVGTAMDLAERFLQLRALTSPTRANQAWAASRAVDALRTAFTSATPEEEEE